MIKRIIFDLDFTLINWKDEYVMALFNVLKKYHLEDKYILADNMISEYEKKYTKLDKYQLLKDINEAINANLPISFLDELFEEQKKLASVDLKLIDLLDYLSKKYDLVLLSNYYHEVQYGRLKTAKIDTYFKEVYGGDDLEELKPSKKAFEKAIGLCKLEECIMVGDSIRCDINGAEEFGIKAILCDTRGIGENYNGLKINNIYELKEVL